MKVELKHIVGYLPYQIKLLCTRNRTSVLDTYIGICAGKNIVDIGYVINNNLMPILRPLSDLTKEIEANGELFFPIDWFEIGDDTNDSEEYDHGNIKLIKTLERISKFNISNDVLYLPHGVVQKLYEWHFDIHGLIENNLAIDINTL